MGSSLLTALRVRPVVADGAMGTMLQQVGADDVGCAELLNVTNPELVAAVHDAFLAAGVEAISTNTFGANRANLADFGLADRVAELAQAGAEIARARADAAAAATGQPRWVLGSLGPGTKLPSLGQISYADLRVSYADAVGGLLRGGVDAILFETCQDPLQVKAAVAGARATLAELDVVVPIIVSVTIEESGTMLLGTQLSAMLALLKGLRVDVVGLNCATGPDLMADHLRLPSQHFSGPIAAMPNAGLPVLGPDGAAYPLSPAELATAQAEFVREFGVSLVGGCCGTTPEHLGAVVDELAGLELPRRAPQPLDAASSLYRAVPLPGPDGLVRVGERTNANGSKAFREALLAQDFDGAVALADAQIAAGADLLDVSVDYVGRTAATDMAEVVRRLATSSTAALMIDSTEPDVLRAGLELIGGRAVVNSVNLEGGTGPESRFAQTMAVVREHGAAVVALTIDERGQARTAADKVAVAVRLIRELTSTWGLRPGDIVVDPLTFPIATGQEETRRDGIETLTALAELRRRFPGVHLMLGVSNVSFGLTPPARRVLNSVFLHEAQAAGLDVAILPAGKLLRCEDVPPEQWQAAEDLIWDRREYGDDGTLTSDPLQRFLALFAEPPTVGRVRGAAACIETTGPDQTTAPAESLRAHIVDGQRAGLAADLDAVLADGVAPLAVLNDVLLPAMAEVGERFAAGTTQLPFVLQSAEVMKAAVDLLQPHLASATDGHAQPNRGTIVLATVRGDVHDIGKNLVDIILSNNGYRVINLGIKVEIAEIIAAAIEHDADVIGLSGLLVKSTQVMREYLAELTAQGLATRWPVILGGAALTRRYVEQDLAAEFPGTVRYAKDAFEGLALMPELVARSRADEADRLHRTAQAQKP